MAIIGTPTPGNDIIRGDALDNFIDALAGNDTVSGNEGNDTLIGGSGSDSIIGGLGNDSINGGTGIDRIRVEALGANITLTNTSVIGEGVDSLTGIENAELFVFQRNGIPGNIDASAFTLGSVTLDGGIGRNNLIGGSGSDFLDGEDANDTLSGGSGNDTLNGGSGNDTLTGGAGTDQFLFDMGGPFSTSDGFDQTTDFKSGTDKIVLSKSTFTALASGPGSLLASDFEIVDNVLDISSSNAKIVYHLNQVYYNQNGSLQGFGTGGLIVDLEVGPNTGGSPNISLSDFIVVA
jgi:Ca2+-binding RTX toxin-like protein